MFKISVSPMRMQQPRTQRKSLFVFRRDRACDWDGGQCHFPRREEGLWLWNEQTVDDFETVRPL